MTGQTWPTNAAWTASQLVALLGVLCATWRSRRRGEERLELMLAGCVALIAGQVYFDAVSGTELVDSPNPADVCRLFFAVFFAAGVQRLAHVARRSRAVSWLELAPLAVAAGTLLLALMWDHLESSTIPDRRAGDRHGVPGVLRHGGPRGPRGCRPRRAGPAPQSGHGRSARRNRGRSVCVHPGLPRAAERLLRRRHRRAGRGVRTGCGPHRPGCLGRRAGGRRRGPHRRRAPPRGDPAVADLSRAGRLPAGLGLRARGGHRTPLPRTSCSASGSSSSAPP